MYRTMYTNHCHRCCTPIRPQVVPFQKDCKICPIRGIGFVIYYPVPRTHRTSIHIIPTQVSFLI